VVEVLEAAAAIFFFASAAEFLLPFPALPLSLLSLLVEPACSSMAAAADSLLSSFFRSSEEPSMVPAAHLSSQRLPEFAAMKLADSRSIP